MIETIVLLGLLAVGVDVVPDVGLDEAAISVDACVDVDEGTVQQLVALEIRDARVRGPRQHASVSVRCIDDALEIRAEPWASSGQDGVRTVHLTPTSADGAAATRQARSRELALAIAELIRRLEVEAQNEEAAPRSSPPRAQEPSPITIEVATAPAAGPPVHTGRLGFSFATEYFTGGQLLVGGDIHLTAIIRRLIVAELILGGRLGADRTIPGGRLHTRAAVGALAVGVRLWSSGDLTDFALLVRGQGHLVQFLSETSDSGASQTATLGALTLALAPRLVVGVSRHLGLVASTALGFSARGISVEIENAEGKSASGAVISGNLGLQVMF